MGFFQLCEARINSGLPWGPLQVLFEHYIHALIINVLFHFNFLASAKSLLHVDNLVLRLNQGPRPLGVEVVGVPEKLTTAAFKLSYLVYQDVSAAPWSLELIAVSKAVRRWEPSTQARKPSANGLYTVGLLYWSACLCLLEHLEIGPTSTRTALYVQEAIKAIQQSRIMEKPFNIISWPLTILGIFAKEVKHRDILIQPLKTLCEGIKLMTYKTSVDFLYDIWQQELGADVLHRPDLLSRVHL